MHTYNQENMFLTNNSNEDEWKTYTKKSKRSKQKKEPSRSFNNQGSHHTIAKVMTNLCENDQDYKFNETYTLWSHEVYGKDWSINGYVKMCVISSVQDFWRVFNHMDKLQHRLLHFYLMKNNIEPIWECKENLNGGTLSFKIGCYQSLKFFEYLSIHMILKTLCNNEDDITGISVSPKNQIDVVRIWNGHHNQQIELNPEITTNYKNIETLYKKNEPQI